MSESMHTSMDGSIHGWIHSWMDPCMDPFMDPLIDPSMDACMDPCMDPCMDALIIFSFQKGSTIPPRVIAPRGLPQQAQMGGPGGRSPPAKSEVFFGRGCSLNISFVNAVCGGVVTHYIRQGEFQRPLRGPLSKAFRIVNSWKHFTSH